MPAATPSIRVEKGVIQLFDIMDAEINMEDYYKNANEILCSPSEHRGNMNDSLKKMRTLYQSGK
jgi:hypothetical protein